MLKDIEGVIFDLDGTLVDSMWVWNSIDIEYLGKRGLEVPKDLNRKIEGMSFEETAQYFKEHFQLEDSVETIARDWNDMARNKYANEVKLKNGALSFIRYLKEHNIKMGIATSNSRLLVELVTKANGIYEYFDKIVTATEVNKGKPEPDVYLKVADEMNVNPCRCLVFEDVVNGIIAGKRAQMKVCAIYDESSKECTKEKQDKADFYVEDFSNIVLV